MAVKEARIWQAAQLEKQGNVMPKGKTGAGVRPVPTDTTHCFVDAAWNPITRFALVFSLVQESRQRCYRCFLTPARLEAVGVGKSATSSSWFLSLQVKALVLFLASLTQSVSLNLVPSKLEKTFVVSAQVFKTTGTASFTGVSRKSCTRSTFHLLPYSEFTLHMRSRSERPSVGCSGSELRSDKYQNSALKNTLGHRSASSLSYKRGFVSLLGGCSTPNIPTIIAFSLPSCATVLHPDNEVLRSFATHTLVYKLRPDVFRSSSASHPGSRVSPARMNCSVDSLTLLAVLSSSSTKERILSPCLFSVKGDDSSGLISKVCFNLLTGLPPCVAVCTGPEGAIETISVSFVGEGWLSTSQHKFFELI
ncbi:hypothetical protein F2Q70_00040252 [Brassica cretica]|uniref:Uncharacterized protein n=1 Tax=Brassica cretica TaxID=69181 RepID=A0A8S9K8A4_BRACR|nr:hypothetical protein F2Q70_00040252 [Brassica cretica]